MSEVKKVAWTDDEKLSFAMQIIESQGKIKWAELVIPAGRTQKACENMISLERQKLKAASAGEPKKRVNEETSVDESPAKKNKSSRKKKSQSRVPADADDEEDKLT